MHSNALFHSKGLVIDGGLAIDDISVIPGDVVWCDSDNPMSFDIFSSFIMGLLGSKKGSAKISSKEMSAVPHTVISYFDIVNWHPHVSSISSLINVLSYSRGLHAPFILNEFKRILSGIGGGYALNLSIGKMTRITRGMVSTSLVMAMPSLIMLLIDPFDGLDNEGAEFLKKEIATTANDGSAIFIMSSLEPPVYNRSMIMEMK